MMNIAPSMPLYSLLSFIDAHLWLRWSVVALLVFLIGFLAWMAPNSSPPKRPRSWWQHPALFIGPLLLLLFFARYPVFFAPTWIDIDEAQLLSEAITLGAHALPWVGVDGTTSGPLNYGALLWCAPFGIQPTYLTGRLFAVICLASMLAFFYAALRNLVDDKTARASLLPTAVFFIFISDHSLTHYSSEHLSLALFGVAIFLLTRLYLNPGALTETLGLGLVLGLLPFAKLQSTLPALFLGSLAILWTVSSLLPFQRTIRLILSLGLAAALPGIVVLFPVIHAGGFNDFLQSYVHNNSAYVAGNASILHRPRNLFNLLLDPAKENAFGIYATLVLFGGVAFAVERGNFSVAPRQRRLLETVGLFFATLLLTMGIPGNPFPHYVLYWFLAQPFMIAASLACLQSAFGSTTDVAGPGNVARRFVPVLLGATGIAAVTGLLAAWSTSYWNTDVLAGKIFLPPVVWLLLGSGALLFLLFSKLNQEAWASSIAPFLGAWAWAAYGLLFFALPVMEIASCPNAYLGRLAEFSAEPLPEMDRMIKQECPPGGRIAIWGYEPRYSCETGLPLGTRDSTTFFCIMPSPLRPYFQARYLRDMERNRPELFLEATGPHSFYFSDSTRDGIQRFPALEQLVLDQYRLVYIGDGMRLFRRSDLPEAPPH